MRYDKINWYKQSIKSLKEMYKFNDTDAKWVLKRLWGKTAKGARANTYEVIYKSIAKNNGYYITIIDKEKGVFELVKNPNYKPNERYDEFLRSQKIPPRLNVEQLTTLDKLNKFLDKYKKYDVVDNAVKAYLLGEINIKQLSNAINKFKNSREYGKEGSA